MNHDKRLILGYEIGKLYLNTLSFRAGKRFE